jgi:hypothetical protein
MAIYSATSDIRAFRFDTGSLFGGVYDRDGVDDTAILLKKTFTVGSTQVPVLIQRNETYGLDKDGKPVTGTTSANDYRIVFTGDIKVFSRWDDADKFGTTGEPASSDYKLDWAESKFSSIAFQIPSAGATLTSGDYNSWTTVVEVASTDPGGMDLPFRSDEYDSDRVEVFRSAYTPTIKPNTNNQVDKDYEGAFNYQSVVYNWQYPFVTSTAQYLFGNDRINGTRNDDVIRGYAGDDRVIGGNGNDLLYADYGNDQLFGGPGDDVLVFSGSSSSWDVDDFAYRKAPIELAVGGSGADMFVFRPSEINWTARDSVFYDMSLPNLYTEKFKYKKVMDYEQKPGHFKVNAAGDILTVDGTKETKVRDKAFSSTNTPFNKLSSEKNQTLSYIELDEINGDIYTRDSNQSKVFIKSGLEVFLNNRFNDDLTIDLSTSGDGDDGHFYVRSSSDNWHYNPFMSQSQNDAYYSGTTGATRATTDPANGLSNLTQRIKIQDFKIGSDKIDLSAFGLSREVLLANDKTLTGKNGATYLKALSDVLKPEGLKITSAKNGWTSGNTSLFLKEDNADFNGNSTKDDTLLEIQLVGINISSLNGRFFGESARTNGSDYDISY